MDNLNKPAVHRPDSITSIGSRTGMDSLRGSSFEGGMK